MKTTNNVQKTGSRKLATGIAVLTLTFAALTSGGQSREPLKSISTDSQIAFAAPHDNGAKQEGLAVRTKGEKFVMGSNETYELLSFKPEEESSMKIESWMIDNKYFASENPEFKADAEKSLNIESWMTDKQIWNK